MFSENSPSYELPPCCDVMGLSNLITVPYVARPVFFFLFVLCIKHKTGQATYAFGLFHITLNNRDKIALFLRFALPSTIRRIRQEKTTFREHCTNRRNLRFSADGECFTNWSFQISQSKCGGNCDHLRFQSDGAVFKILHHSADISKY